MPAPTICPCGIALVMVEPSEAARKWDLPVWKIWIATGCGMLYIGVVLSRERPSVTVARGLWSPSDSFFVRVS